MPPSTPDYHAPLRNLPDALMIGVSGGVDSVSLLHALVQIGKKPTVLHFDHGWRKESFADAQWIQQLAQSYGLPLVLGKAPKNSPHTESAARTLRDRFFEQTAKRLQIKDLVLAHHANDQVETFLLQLFRGTGSHGFGMESIAERNTLTRWRPWLCIWKSEIASFAQANSLSWREDSTNLDPRHQRNWIRNELLPLLSSRLGREIPPLLLRTSTLLRDQTLSLLQSIAPLISCDELPLAPLAALSLAQQRLLVKSWLHHHSIPDVSFEKIEAIVTLITQTKPAKINLAKGDFVRRTNGKIWIERGPKIRRNASKK